MIDGVYFRTFSWLSSVNTCLTYSVRSNIYDRLLQQIKAIAIGASVHEIVSRCLDGRFMFLCLLACMLVQSSLLGRCLHFSLAETCSPTAEYQAAGGAVCLGEDSLHRPSVCKRYN